MPRRLTAHNGRTGSSGVYSARHNDRNFDLDNTQHIDSSRTTLNQYWHCYQSHDKTISFDAAEKKHMSLCSPDTCSDRTSVTRNLVMLTDVARWMSTARKPGRVQRKYYIISETRTKMLTLMS